MSRQLPLVRKGLLNSSISVANLVVPFWSAANTIGCIISRREDRGARLVAGCASCRRKHRRSPKAGRHLLIPTVFGLRGLRSLRCSIPLIRTLPPYTNFEIDIISALSSQLVAAFSKLEIGQLADEQIDSPPKGQGVYKLYYYGARVYVGKAEQLKKRLGEHRFKISGRQHIESSDMGFKCLFIHRNWTALAPEDSLIRHYRAASEGGCAWNGNGFGPHDPGRDRESTDKHPEGFDSQFPIRKDWICDWIEAGSHNAFALLKNMKRGLPYLLRFQTAKKQSAKPHEDYQDLTIGVPRDRMGAEDLLRTIAQALPGWQATAFPSHLILYKEKREYTYGHIIWPPPA